MEIKKYGIYKHFKGKYYIVLDIATDTETGEDLVIYRALYDDNKLWARNKQMFLSKVDKTKYPSSKQDYRFELQEMSDNNDK